MSVSLHMLKNDFVPMPKRDDVAVIDNLRAHEVTGVRGAIETARARLRKSAVFPEP